MSDLWTEATYDAEAEALSQRVTAAKVAAADLMPFLLAAETEVDFRNRKAMVADRLDAVVSATLSDRSVVEGLGDPSLFGVVRATLEGHIDEDFQTLATARREETERQERIAAEARQMEEGFLARVQATLAAKQAETKQAARDTGNCAECGRAISYDSSSRSWSHDNEGPDTQHPAKKASLQTVAFTEFCKTCNAGLVGGPETGWKHAGPDGEKEDADHKPEPGGQGYSKSSSLQTQAEFPPKKDEEKAPAATGTETEHKPEEQKSSGGVERKVELDPATGQYVGSEWEESEDGATLVQSSSTYGNNPRFASEEEANGWVAESAKEEDTTKAEEQPAEQPKSDNPFPEKEGKQSVPFGSEAAKTAGFACGNCGSSDVTLTIAPGASGSGPGGGWRMGDDGGTDVLQCRACGAQTPAFPKQAAAGDTCPTCHGSGQVAAPEGSTNEGYEPCPDCSGTGKTASVKTASWVDTAKEVVLKHQFTNYGPDSMLLDATTATMLLSVYEALSPENQQRFAEMDLHRAVDLGWKLVSQQKASSAKTAADVSLHWKQVIDAGITREDLIANVPAEQMNSALDYWDKSKNKTAGWFDRKPKDEPATTGGSTFSNPEQQRLWEAAKAANDADALDYLADPDPDPAVIAHYTEKYPKTAAAQEGDAAPFVREAAEDLTSEAFSRNDKGMPQDPVPSGKSNPYVPSPGAVSSEPIKAEDKPWYYGLGETNPERRQKAREDMPDRKPKDTGSTASIEEITARLISEADSNPYSTQGNPYVPPQVPPGTSDDVLDGPVNPAPQMLEVPMTTRPRQMPSGDSTLPDASLDDPAEPDQHKEIL